MVEPTERPQIFQETSGVRKSYALTLSAFYSNILLLSGSLVNEEFLLNCVPSSKAQRLSFLSFLHHEMELTMDALTQMGVPEYEPHELLVRFQAIFERDLGDPSEENALPVNQNGERYQIDKMLMHWDDIIKNTTEQLPPDDRKDRKLFIRSSDIHDFSHIAEDIIYSPHIPEALKTQINAMVRAMRTVNQVMHTSAKMPYPLFNVVNRISKGIALSWMEYVEEMKLQVDNPLVSSALLEAHSLFQSVLEIHEVETFDLISFLSNQIPYLESVGDRNDRGKKIKIHFDNETGHDNHVFIKASTGSMLTLVRNLVQDAILHGDYPEDTVDLNIRIHPTDRTGIIDLSVSNPLHTTKETVNELCEKLGIVRVVLTDEGALIIKEEDLDGKFGTHGLGKLSVASTTYNTLVKNGVHPQTAREMTERQWTYSDLPMLPNNLNENEADKRKWFRITCKVALKLAA